MKSPVTLDLSHPAILEELWESSTFDEGVYRLLERYTQAQETGTLATDSPEIRQLTKDIYYHLTTTRNRNLITDTQQQILRQSVGGFFGLSTGSHAVTTWLMESRADSVKIVDPDHISPSNLNRMRFGWDMVGHDKVDVVKTELLKISPYSMVISTTKTDEATTSALFTDTPKLNFIVEAIDDLKAKVKLRLLAKQHRLPYLMATDVGDNVFLDIERYDVSPQPKLFNGRVDEIEKVDFDHISLQERVRLSMKIVGFESNSVAMLSSLHSIGKKIATWPQLGATACIAGGLITTALKKILLGEPILSGRYYFCPDEVMVSDFNSLQNRKAREKWIVQIHQRFGGK